MSSSRRKFITCVQTYAIVRDIVSGRDIAGAVVGEAFDIDTDSPLLIGLDIVECARDYVRYQYGIISAPEWLMGVSARG